MSGLSCGPSTVTARREFDFLRRCLRARSDAESLESIRLLIQEDMDWSFLIRTAIRHGVMPLLYRTLQGLCPEEVPAPHGAQLAEYYRLNVARTLSLINALRAILAEFRLRDIPCIPFKGPVLSSLIYSDCTLRQSPQDLDILAWRRHSNTIQTLLTLQGFHRQLGPATPGLLDSDEAEFVYCHTYSCGQNDTTMILEVHFELMPKSYRFNIDYDALWNRTIPVSLSGVDVPSLSPQDLLLYLCAHGAKHHWYRLGWICDVAELIRTQHQLDWDATLGQARAIGSKRLLFLGLLLAKNVIGTTIPENVLTVIREDSHVNALARWVEGRLSWEAGKPYFADLWKLNLDARERLLDKVQCCVGAGMNPSDPLLRDLSLRARILMPVMKVLTPNERDLVAFPLPRSLSFLLYLARPLRLTAKYAHNPLELFRKIRQIVSY